MNSNPYENLSKLELIRMARKFLSGETLRQPHTAKGLAAELQNRELYAYAAEIYLELLNDDLSIDVRKRFLHKLAFCMYKDPDLPASTKFDDAIVYLMEIDDFNDTEDLDIYGKLGATYKYKWYHDNKFSNLIYSRNFYKKGYDTWLSHWNEYLDPDTKLFDYDNGYNGINYAFVLELMASVRLRIAAQLPENEPAVADEWLRQAQEVREKIIEYLPRFIQFVPAYNANKPAEDHKRIEEWVWATWGEASFALGDYSTAADQFQKYVDTQPQNWKISSTARQLITLSELKIDIKTVQTAYALRRTDKKSEQNNLRAELNAYKTSVEQQTRTCLNVLYGKGATQQMPLPEGFLRGKVGLALSGGGFRASLYHIGVLAALAERDVLRHVEAISCVSGGSIAGAYYYLLLKDLLEKHPDGESSIPREKYMELVKTMETEFLRGVQTNIRMQIISSVCGNLRIFLDKEYSRTQKLAELYDKVLYKPVLAKSGNPLPDVFMQHLKLNLPDTGHFDPKRDNWRRFNKVPVLVLNATTLNTGHNWQFTASWMGEPPANIQPEIDCKPRLRRMYYEEAPPPYTNRVRLGTAVGSSSCVPALFAPVHFPDLYEGGLDVLLVDGGVHDNQGIASLLEQECQIIIVSDASGQLPTDPKPSDSAFGSFFRSDAIFMERIRENQFLDISQRYASGQIKGLMVTHLKKDLQANPVKWMFSEDPTRKIWLKEHKGDNIQRTNYGVLKDVQECVAGLRTDLDAFSDVEAYALMYSGYRQTIYEFEKMEWERLFPASPEPQLSEEEKQKITPDFLKIEPYMTVPLKSQALLKRLRIGKDVPFKILNANSMVRTSMIILGVAALFLLVAGLIIFRDKVLFSVSVAGLGITLALLVADFFVSPYVSKVFRWKTSLLKLAAKVVGAVLLAWFCQFYLQVINPLFLRYGTLEALEKPEKKFSLFKTLRRFLG